MTEGTALVEIGIPHELAEGNGCPPGSGIPPALFLKEARAAERFFDFFTANIQNKHTRRAYFNAACRFSAFCAERGVHDLAYVKPVHVAGYVESLRDGFAKPTIKQHLAAICMLFDWLVVGQIIDANPAHAVRGPRVEDRRAAFGDHMPAHSSPRTTKLYDRRNDETALDEYEKVRI